jgi:hypothetical protein
MVPPQFLYLVGCIPLLIMWVIFFIRRKDLRPEMLIMSIFIGAVSVASAYYWWTIDWWRPLTITGTRVGIEDFLMGFLSGGIMAVIYEEVFKRRYIKRKILGHQPGAATLLLLLAFATSFLIWGTRLTSFEASTIAMTLTSTLMFVYRRDLFLNGLLSGALMVCAAFFFYYSILFFDPRWIDTTYQFSSLSGVRAIGVPIEEFIFWFLAGLLFGPFYEYWQGERLSDKN